MLVSTYLWSVTTIMWQYLSVWAPHVHGYYYSTLCQFLAKSNGSLEIDCVPTAATERDNNEYIMDVACTPYDYKVIINWMSGPVHWHRNKKKILVYKLPPGEKNIRPMYCWQQIHSTKYTKRWAKHTRQCSLRLEEITQQNVSRHSVA